MRYVPQLNQHLWGVMETLLSYVELRLFVLLQEQITNCSRVWKIHDNFGRGYQLYLVITLWDYPLAVRNGPLEAGKEL